MCCTKCIIYKYVSKRSKFFGESLSVLCLFCTITCILKKNNISIFHSGYCCFCIVAYYVSICCKFYFLSKKFGKTNCNRCQRKFWFWLSFWLTKMRTKNDFSTIFDQFLDGRKSCYKTVFICDLAIFQRYIEIAAYKNFFALYIDIIY